MGQFVDNATSVTPQGTRFNDRITIRSGTTGAEVHIDRDAEGVFTFSVQVGVATQVVGTPTPVTDSTAAENFASALQRALDITASA